MGNHEMGGCGLRGLRLEIVNPSSGREFASRVIGADAEKAGKQGSSCEDTSSTKGIESRESVKREEVQSVQPFIYMLCRIKWRRSPPPCLEKTYQYAYCIHPHSKKAAHNRGCGYPSTLPPQHLSAKSQRISSLAQAGNTTLARPMPTTHTQIVMVLHCVTNGAHPYLSGLFHYSLVPLLSRHRPFS